MKQIILVGGGGHCKSCIDVIERENKFKISGIVDVKEKLHQKVLGYEIIATDEDLLNLSKKYEYFLITIGQIKNHKIRKAKFEYLKKINVKFPTIISPLAYISRFAFLGEGTILMHRAFVNSGARIGKNCIINTGCIIEHDAEIGDNCHISTGVIVNGKVKIGEGTFIGSNSVIAHNLNISSGVVIGAGSVVTKSVLEKGIYAGVPLKRIG